MFSNYLEKYLPETIVFHLHWQAVFGQFVLALNYSTLDQKLINDYNDEVPTLCINLRVIISTSYEEL